MKFKKLEFPNPILKKGSEDYKDTCSFSILVDGDQISVDERFINIPVHYVLQCHSISKLIENQLAVVAIRVISTRVSFARVYYFDEYNRTITIKVDKFSVQENITITGYVVATKRIGEFTANNELNDTFFNGVTFDIRKGDILAIDGEHIINVDITELEKPISSIVSIRREDEIESDMVPDFEDDKIVIYLKSAVYSNYVSLKALDKGLFERFISAVVVYPVIVEALCFVAANNVEYSEKRWFRALQYKLKEKNIDISDKSLSVVADNILGSICSDALQQLMIVNRELSDGEGIDCIGGDI